MHRACVPQPDLILDERLLRADCEVEEGHAG
jgi:hypothetical protein